MLVSVIALVLELCGILTCAYADEILKEFPFRAEVARILCALMVLTIVVGIWNT